MIEHENELRQRSGSAFGAFNFNAKKAKEEGMKSKRDRNYKHFTEVAYTGDENKAVPRWAIDHEKLKIIKEHQMQNLDPQKIFGKWGPKVV